MRSTRVALVLIAALVPSCMALADAPPQLDCGLGFDGTRAAVAQMPGAVPAEAAGFQTVAVENGNVWMVEYAFTTPEHPAHPAIVMRTMIRQVTEVWTSQSKGCGFGDASAFASLMAAEKTRDSELTNASRAKAERNKQKSPLGGAP